MSQTQSMQGKIVLVTGGTGGIGKETALGLANMGAHVVITGRDRERGEAAVADLKQRSRSKTIDLLLTDLSLQDETRRLAADFAARYARLDILINNAGLLNGERVMTVEGVEADFAVNVIAPFLLTHELMPSLKKSAEGRVINVTGGMASTIDMDNLQAEKSFLGLATYSQAKMVMMAVSYEFAQRVQGTGVTINVCYPGAANTPMTRGMTPNMVPFVMRLMWPIFKTMFGRDDGTSAAKAARSSILLAWSPELAGVNGQYFNTKGKLTTWPKVVLDAAMRRQLWALCEKLTESETLVAAHA